MSGVPVKLSSPDQFDTNTMQLVFVHIPKAGGTSLHASLSAISKDRYLHFVPGENNPEDINTFWGFGGHFDYEMPLAQATTKDRVYVTLLRDPVERFVSFYHHVQAHHYHHLSQLHPELLEMEPFDFARKLAAIGDPEISNLQCKMITGCGGISGIRAANHARAKFTICAPFNRQDQVIKWLAHAAGIEAPPTQQLNISQPKKALELDPATKAYIEELNADDIVLFESASAPV